jgi:hypothetical protein
MSADTLLFTTRCSYDSNSTDICAGRSKKPEVVAASGSLSVGCNRVSWTRAFEVVVQRLERLVTMAAQPVTPCGRLAERAKRFTSTKSTHHRPTASTLISTFDKRFNGTVREIAQKLSVDLISLCYHDSWRLYTPSSSLLLIFQSFSVASS